jgi:hypothetical protein
MGAPVLKRQLQSYEKAYQQYLGQVRGFKKEADAYNKAIDYYNQSFVTDENGNKLVYDKSNQLKAVTPEGKIVEAKISRPEPDPNAVQQVNNGMGGMSVQPAPAPRNPYEPIESSVGMGAGSYAIPKDVITQDVGGGYKAAKQYEAEQPGDAPTPPQFTAEAPNPTKAQMQKLNQPSWSDIERGLIGEVIRTR